MSDEKRTEDGLAVLISQIRDENIEKDERVRLVKRLSMFSEDLQALSLLRELLCTEFTKNAAFNTLVNIGSEKAVEVLIDQVSRYSINQVEDLGRIARRLPLKCVLALFDDPRLADARNNSSDDVRIQLVDNLVRGGTPECYQRLAELFDLYLDSSNTTFRLLQAMYAVDPEKTAPIAHERLIRMFSHNDIPSGLGRFLTDLASRHTTILHDIIKAFVTSSCNEEYAILNANIRKDIVNFLDDVIMLLHRYNDAGLVDTVKKFLDKALCNEEALAKVEVDAEEKLYGEKVDKDLISENSFEIRRLISDALLKIEKAELWRSTSGPEVDADM